MSFWRPWKLSLWNLVVRELPHVQWKRRRVTWKDGECLVPSFKTSPYHKAMETFRSLWKTQIGLSPWILSPQLSPCKCHTGLLVMSFQDHSDVSACLPPHCHRCYLSKPPSSHSGWLTHFLSHPFQFILNHSVKLTTSECRSVNNTLLFKTLRWFSIALRINSHHD